MKQKITPYNTGKVLIGKDYVPTTRHVVSQDMFRLQASLLGKPEPTTPETWMLRFVAAFAVVIIVLDLFVWRP